MTQACSLSSSTADVNNVCNNKRLPKGIRIVGTDEKSASKVGNVSSCEVESNNSDSENVAVRHEAETANHCEGVTQQSELPWGYIFIQHMSADVFEKNLANRKIEGDFKPKCFVHRTVKYKQHPSGKGVMKEDKPSVSGLVFLQGETEQLKGFLRLNYPRYFLVNDCSTGKPASIPDATMRPFMQIMKEEPERITFLRDPFVKFAKDHVKLRVLTGVMAGQVGYVVRILKNRQLVMDFAGYAVAINNVYNEDFEVAE